MPRFPVNFRRKSTAEDPNGPVAEPSFRVLDRNDVNTGKSFDGGVRLAKMTGNATKSNVPDLAMEDNIFAGLKNNRGSGSSNTTKTASDNSSRHSNASTAPSSTEHIQEDWRTMARKSVPMADGPASPAHKSSASFLKQAGRTFSFGVNKKNSLPTIPAEDPVPAMPEYLPQTPTGRSRAETASSASTATPPQVDRDFMFDLGGDLSAMLNKFDKRSSVATLKDRNSTPNRANHPSPLHFDHSAPVDPPPKSWHSQNSNDGLLASRHEHPSIPDTNDMAPPPVPKHDDGLSGRRKSDEDGEDTTLLMDTLAANQFLSDDATRDGSRYRREDTNPRFRSELTETYSKPSRFDTMSEDDNMFDKSFGRPPKVVSRIGARANSQPQNKVMTPEEFEKYRRDKAQEERMGLVDESDSDKEEEDNYEDEDDAEEKSKQLARQRRKQEAHMTVYRQQMMKVTGESSTNAASHRPTISMSMSTPELPIINAPNTGPSPSPPSDGSEDEEVPLAILAAHGFPNKNRPPTRLSTVGSNPNLRASMQPSYTAGQGSVAGDSNAQAGTNGGRLPPFARKLPQDPYLGAGLVNQPPRESFALGGGAPPQARAAPAGGLVGVIASEERSRALRRGSPAVDPTKPIMPLPANMQLNGMPANGGFDPTSGIPPQMMYPMGTPQMTGPMLSPGDQAQIQMTQQMQQFMQMQMQFMQMMASQGQGQGQGQNPGQGQVPLRPQGHIPTQSMGSFNEMSRNSFMGDPMTTAGMRSSMNLELPRSDSQMRTMSMVQPNSASWVQPPQPGYGAPSIHIQGAGYAPSIAPSERSNIGLPGRYRPVSSVMGIDPSGRTSTLSGAMPTLHSKLQTETKVSQVNKDDDDDDEQGWEAMKAKREQKKSLWRTKKSFGDDIGALIN